MCGFVGEVILIISHYFTYRESVSSTETTADVDGVLSSKMDNLDLAKHREEPRVSLEQVQVVS